MSDALRLIDHPLVATLGWTLTHFVWQGAVLGLVAFFILRVVRPVQASTRYVVGLCTLAAMLMVPVATFISTAGHASSTRSGWQRTPSQTGVAGAGLVTGAIVADLAANPAGVRELLPPSGAADTSRDVAPIAPVWLPLVTAVWMLGVVVLSLRMLGGWALTLLLARRAVGAVQEEVDRAAREMARRLRLRREFEVVESALVSVPTLVGWIKPVVLLPASALTGLTPQQLQAVIAHELAHIRRHDYLVNLLQTFVETLLFYHPAVWWVSSEIRTEREHCCDDLAVAVCGDRLVYVSALAELTSIERRAFALAATDGSLVTRVRRLLGRTGETRRELPPSWSILVLLILVGGGAGTYEMSADASDVAQIARAAAANAPQMTIYGDESPSASVIQPPPAPPASPAPPAESASPAPPARPAPVPVAPLAPPPPPAPPISPDAVPPAPGESEMFAAPRAQSAPSAPSAPTAPTAPSAPSAGSGTQGNFVWSNDNERLTVKWTGAFRLSDDERDVDWVEEGKTLTIADGWVFTDRVELRGLPGGKIERQYYRSGFQREFDAEGRTFLATAIQRMIRAGMFATERVARLLEQGGPEAVMAAVDRMENASSHVRRVYYSALLKQADLNSAQLSRLIERVTSTVSSDHEKGTLLAQALQETTITDEQRALVARAASRISSDHEQRKVLTAALAGGAGAPAVVTAVLEALDQVKSAHERSTVLVDIARKGGVTAQTSDAFMNSVTTMASAHEQRKVLTALAGTPVFVDAVARDGMKAVAVIASSHDKSEVLLQIIGRNGVNETTAPSFFAAVESLNSSHDKYRVLAALTASGRMSDAILAAFLRATKGISSSHNRAQVLLQLLKAQPITGTNRTLFLEAAESISGTHDQNQVLAALVRAERR